MPQGDHLCQVRKEGGSALGRHPGHLPQEVDGAVAALPRLLVPARRPAGQQQAGVRAKHGQMPATQGEGGSKEPPCCRPGGPRSTQVASCRQGKRAWRRCHPGSSRHPAAPWTRAAPQAGTWTSPPAAPAGPCQARRAQRRPGRRRAVRPSRRVAAGRQEAARCDLRGGRPGRQASVTAGPAGRRRLAPPTTARRGTLKEALSERPAGLQMRTRTGRGAGRAPELGQDSVQGSMPIGTHCAAQRDGGVFSHAEDVVRQVLEPQRVDHLQELQQGTRQGLGGRVSRLRGGTAGRRQGWQAGSRNADTCKHRLIL